MSNLTKRGLFGVAALAPFLFPVIAQAKSAGSVVDNGGTGLKIEMLDHAIDAHGAAGALIMDVRLRNMLTAFSRLPGNATFIYWDKDDTGTRRAYYNDLPILVTRPADPGRPFTDIVVVGRDDYNALKAEHIVAYHKTMQVLRKRGSVLLTNIGARAPIG